MTIRQIKNNINMTKRHRKEIEMTDTKKLKAKMVENGILLDTLAKKVGISRASLSYKINNKRQFSAEEIRDISSELQLKSEEIHQIFLN